MQRFIAIVFVLCSLKPAYLRIHSSKNAGGFIPSIPYIVSIQGRTPMGGYKHLCGGSIIDEDIILTAAHCFLEHNNPQRLSVVAGSKMVLSDENDIYRRKVVDIAIHPFFLPLQGRDIALLRIKPKFIIDGKLIRKIPYNTHEEIQENINVRLLSWSKTTNSIKSTEFVDFSTLNLDTCRDRGYYQVTSTELCVVSYGWRGACDGDSGSPLFNVDLSLQLGIMSYGVYSCKVNKIFVFTNLKPLADWINRTIQELKEQQPSYSYSWNY